MKYNARKIFTFVFSMMLAVSTFATPVSFDQPFMEKALDNLKDARTYLNRATADKGGHRNNALNKVNQAINAVNNGIAFDRTHLGNRPRRNSADENTDLYDSSALADQPNMQAAKDELEKAINNLNRASADKGGWRNKALDLTRDAINQVNAGIEYDRMH